MASRDSPPVDLPTRLWSRAGGTLAWLVFAMLLAPSLIIVPVSFGNQHEIVFPPHHFSWDLYRDYFFTSTWVANTLQSLRVAILSTMLASIVGFFAAFALVRMTFPGKRIVNLVLLSPIMVPAVVVALGSYLYFSSVGIAPTLGLVLAHAVHITPFIIVTTMAGLRQVDPVLERAATIMGAGRLQCIWRVTLPLVMPSLVAGALFAFLISFDEVVIAYFVTGPDSQTLPVKMYSSIKWEISPVIAAISTLLTLLSLIICVGGAVVRKDERYG